jgi:hypothetical protein
LIRPKASLNEIFNQINTAELDEVRKRAIKFLVAKIPTLLVETAISPATSNKELEDLVIKNVKEVLVDVDAEEFILFIKLLTGLPSMSTLQGRQDLVNIIMAQSELDKPLDVNDLERLMILMSCIQQAIPLFSKNVPSTRYVSLYLENVLGLFKKIGDENARFEILKAFAELCIHYAAVGSAVVVAQAGVAAVQPPNLDLLYELLVEYLPVPPVESDQQQMQLQEDDKFNFSYVECLLFAFHMIVKAQPEYLSGPEAKDKLRDFRLRLQYFAIGTQNYIKELRNSLGSGATKEEEQVNFLVYD